MEVSTVEVTMIKRVGGVHAAERCVRPVPLSWVQERVDIPFVAVSHWVSETLATVAMTPDVSVCSVRVFASNLDHRVPERQGVRVCVCARLFVCVSIYV